MTQTPQNLTAHLGFAVPKLLAQAGISELFDSDMRFIAALYKKISNKYPHAASYVIPNAFNRRVLLQMNLRSAFHFCHLRTAPNAHFAIRRAAIRIADEIQAGFPLFSKYFKPDSSENWLGLTEEYFERV